MKIKFLNQIFAQDIKEVGGKAAALGQLLSWGFNVPSGFVITSENFSESDVLESFDKLGAESVAVRSSATVEDGVENSFAGIFKTYLGVNKKDLLRDIRLCIESRNLPRVQEYCQAKNIDYLKINMAIIIQKMVDSDTAGVCFTADPVTNNQDRLIIEAVYGFGEALVSGEIIPDHFVIDKNNLKVLERNINQEKQVISDEEIAKLSQKAVEIEQRFNKPIDIEWAFEKGELYIIQARPITTL